MVETKGSFGAATTEHGTKCENTPSKDVSDCWYGVRWNRAEATVICQLIDY